MRDLLAREGGSFRLGRFALLTLIAVSTFPVSAVAADATASAARPIRGGAGLRVGSWAVHDLTAPANGRASASVAAEGWLQKGLDQNLVIESTLGFWQRTQSVTEPGPLGTQTDRERQTYLVPTMTALKLYPMGRSASPFEPYLLAGGGLVFGFDREKVSGTDPGVLPGESTTLNTGLGLQTGGGVEWSPGGQFGLAVGGRYQWASFSQQVGGRRMYRGPGLSAGITYRFRYD